MGKILKEKKVKLLNRINENDKSYTYLCRGLYNSAGGVEILNQFKRAKIVETEKIGRRLKINLTNKGTEILKNLNIVDNNIK